MKVTMTSFPSHSSSSSILLNTGQVFDCAKDKSTLVNGKQLLANKPLNVGLVGGSQHSITSSTNIGSSSKNKKNRDKHKSNKYASDPARKQRGEADGSSGGCCCRCMGPKSTAFWIGLLTNLGICTLLLAYTLFGECFLIDRFFSLFSTINLTFQFIIH